MATCTYTEEQIQFVRENWRLMSASEIGARFGRSRCAICGLAHRLGLSKGLARPRANRGPSLVKPPEPSHSMHFKRPGLPKLRFMGEL